MQWLLKLSILLSVLLLGLPGYALFTTGTLPKGISSPSFRYGFIDNVGERYVEDGTLMNLGDVKSLVLDSATVIRMNADAQKLIDALNSFGDTGLGSKFNFGVLRVHTKPQVKYSAPIFAHGFTENWTVAVGVPVITYKNEASVTHDYSNIQYYREQFRGLSTELDKALNLDLAQATNEALVGKGYQPLSHRNESFLGDIYLASVYKFFEDAHSAAIYMGTLGLPSGPAYNPDDLMALNIFGRTTLNNTLAYSRKITSGLSLMPYASYLFNFQDSISARVPLNEEDTLPDLSAKQEVTRNLGDTLTLGANAFYQFNDSWMLGVAYEQSQKKTDSYSGSQPSRYDLLSRNTQARAQRVKGELTYSSIKSYFSKSAKIPLMVSLEISDVIAGMNVERQLVQEMNLILFF